MKLKDKIRELKNITQSIFLAYEPEDICENIKSIGDLEKEIKLLQNELNHKSKEIKSLREAMFKLTHAYVDLQRRFKNESIYKVSKDDLSDRGQEKTT